MPLNCGWYLLSINLPRIYPHCWLQFISIPLTKHPSNNPQYSLILESVNMEWNRSVLPHHTCIHVSIYIWFNKFQIKGSQIISWFGQATKLWSWVMYRVWWLPTKLLTYCHGPLTLQFGVITIYHLYSYELDKAF